MIKCFFAYFQHKGIVTVQKSRICGEVKGLSPSLGRGPWQLHTQSEAAITFLNCQKLSCCNYGFTARFVYRMCFKANCFFLLTRIETRYSLWEKIPDPLQPLFLFSRPYPWLNADNTSGVFCVRRASISFVGFQPLIGAFIFSLVYSQPSVHHTAVWMGMCIDQSQPP